MADVRYIFNLTQVSYVEVDADLSDIAAQPQRFYQAGDIAWVMVASGLVFLMVPGLALFYSGMNPKSSSVSNAWLPLMCAAIVGVQWFLVGYAVTFSNWPQDTVFWGGTDGIALHNVLLHPVPSSSNNALAGPYLPEILYFMFEGMFGSFTAAVIAGAAMWKDRPGHFLIFVLFWATFVYEPIARWTWSPDGWSNQWGALDFAGGSGVHICAGGTVLAHSLFHKFLLKRYELFLRSLLGGQAEESGLVLEIPGTNRSATRDNPGEKAPVEPRSDCVSVLIGTLLVWVGWFGFNGGRALGANLRAVSACVSTHIAACTGAAVLSILGAHYSKDNSKEKRASFKFSITHFCNGAIIALVAITPAAGFVPPTVAPLFGAIPTTICFLLEDITEISERLGDEQEIFVIHGVGGFLGMLMTGFFARGYIAALDGYTSPDAHRGGWDGNWFQLLIQFSDACAALGYAFIVSFAILLFLEPFMFLARSRQLRNNQDNGKVDDNDVITELNGSTDNLN